MTLPRSPTYRYVYLYQNVSTVSLNFLCCCLFSVLKFCSFVFLSFDIGIMHLSLIKNSLYNEILSRILYHFVLNSSYIISAAYIDLRNCARARRKTGSYHALGDEKNLGRSTCICRTVDVHYPEWNLDKSRLSPRAGHSDSSRVRNDFSRTEIVYHPYCHYQHIEENFSFDTIFLCGGM